MSPGGPDQALSGGSRSRVGLQYSEIASFNSIPRLSIILQLDIYEKHAMGGNGEGSKPNTSSVGTDETSSSFL